MKYEHLFFVELMDYTECQGFLSDDEVPNDEFVAEKIVELLVEYDRDVRAVYYHATQAAAKGKNIPLRYA